MSHSGPWSVKDTCPFVPVSVGVVQRGRNLPLSVLLTRNTALERRSSVSHLLCVPSYVCLTTQSVFVSVSVSVLVAFLSLCLFACLLLFLSTCLIICLLLFLSLTFCFLVCPSICLSLLVCLCASSCLSTCLCTFHHFFFSSNHFPLWSSLTWWGSALCWAGCGTLRVLQQQRRAAAADW